MIEYIEWFSTKNKPKDYIPILVYTPSAEPYPAVREAYYLTVNGVGMWNVVHPMVGGFVPERDIKAWAYMPKGILIDS